MHFLVFGAVVTNMDSAAISITLLRSDERRPEAFLSADLTHKSATELVALIRSRAVSPVEVLEAHLKQIDAVNPSLNAIVTIAEDLFDRARDAEDAIVKDREVGPLHGLPITIKDTIETKGLRTTAGSKLLSDNIPTRDATVVARLKAAGAIILGKTNVPEMAAYYETDNPIFGHTNNPYNLTRTAGGSSGGEAAAIASCMSAAGIGSDLAGSIRLPAHFCGITGLKPTMGRVPVDGHIPAVEGSLSLGGNIGPLARTVADLDLLFKVIGDGPFSPTASEIKGLRVAWYTNDGVTPVDNETASAVERATNILRDAGCQVVREKPPGVSEGFGLWMDLFSRAVLRQLSEIYRGREREAGPQVSAMLAKLSAEDDDREGKIAEAEALANAVVARERSRERLLRWMKTTPIIIAPVGATSAWPHGTKRLKVEGESVSVFRAFSYSQTFNVFGLPAVSVPVTRSSDGLPIGVQIIGRPFAEDEVLAAAKIIEAAGQGRAPLSVLL
jgi:Asp-tRNA(Asn)/Glu-tRNA(Gln) amidotransferase A subunit family amidase